eukprot:682523-Prymnesium_polylepis.1
MEPAGKRRCFAAGHRPQKARAFAVACSSKPSCAPNAVSAPDAGVCCEAKMILLGQLPAKLHSSSAAPRGEFDRSRTNRTQSNILTLIS